MRTEQPRWYIAIQGSCALVIFVVNSGLPTALKHYSATVPIIRSGYLHYFSYTFHLLFCFYLGTFGALIVESLRQYEISSTITAFSEASLCLSLAYELERFISQEQEPTWYCHVISWTLLCLFETFNIILLSLQPTTPLFDIFTSCLKGLISIFLLAKFFHLKEYKRLSGSDFQYTTDCEANTDEEDCTEHQAKAPKALDIRREAQEEVRELWGWLPFVRRFHIFLEYMWPWDQYVLQLRAVLAIVIALLASILDYLEPIQHAVFVNAIVAGNDEVIRRSFLNLVLLQLFNSPMSLLTVRKVLWIDVSYYRAGKLKLAVQTHILNLDHHFHSLVPATDLIKAVDYAGDVDKLFDSLCFGFGPNIVRFILAFSGLLHRFGSFMMLILVCTVIFYSLLEKRGIVVLTREHDRYITVNDAQEHRRQDGVRGWATVSNHNQINFEISCFKSEVANFFHQARKYWVRSYTFDFLQSWTLRTGGWAAEIFILCEIHAGRRSIGDLLAFSGLWKLLLASINYFASIPSDKLEQLLNATRLRRIMESKPVLQGGKEALKDIKGNIEFRKVRFSYPETEDNVLDDLSLKIEGGTTVALVGPSGGGKSTLIQLIKHQNNPTKGVILIDGLDVSSIQNSSLHEHVGMMPQKPYFFNKTIVENLMYANRNATIADVYDAAGRAEIHESIMKLKDGYETRMKANGINFSGGELQRLALARLFLQNPSIVLIDEGTSALDAKTEASIKQSIEKKFANKTVIIIAHRLSSIKDADRILVFGKGGNILEDGKHTDLIEGNGHYAHLWKIHIGDCGEKPLIDLS